MERQQTKTKTPKKKKEQSQSGLMTQYTKVIDGHGHCFAYFF